MADKVQFELVVPERLFMSRAADMVVVPGSEGNFGVLPGHAPLVSTLRPEVLEVHDADKVEEPIFVAGGFAEVTFERCTVLADGAELVRDLDRASIERAARELEESLAEAKDEAERRTIERGLALARAKLAVIDRQGGR
ncbi:MAG: ATP synthase F1 subunit epsilon [Alphaproteobacteria bacterium]